MRFPQAFFPRGVEMALGETEYAQRPESAGRSPPKVRRSQPKAQLSLRENRPGFAGLSGWVRLRP